MSRRWRDEMFLYPNNSYRVQQGMAQDTVPSMPARHWRRCVAHSAFLYDVLVFLLAAVVVVPALRYVRLSPVLGYLAAGVLVGPYGLGFIG